MDTVTQEIMVQRHVVYTLDGNAEYAHVFAAPNAPVAELVPAGALDVREMTEKDLEAAFALPEKEQELLDALWMLDVKYFSNKATEINAKLGDAEALAILCERMAAHEAEAAPLRDALRNLRETAGT